MTTTKRQQDPSSSDSESHSHSPPAPDNEPDKTKTAPKTTQETRSKRTLYNPSDQSEAETFDYESNPTIFGKILRGEIKAEFLLETDTLLAFRDIRPRAPFHGLVIPKQRIPSVLDLDPAKNDHRALVDELQASADRLLEEHQPEAYAGGDYHLVFHVPPFATVDHLHLHVVAPASAMKGWFTRDEFRASKWKAAIEVLLAMPHVEFHDNSRWNADLATVKERLESGRPPTAHRKDDGWMDVASKTWSSIRNIVVPPAPCPPLPSLQTANSK